MKNSNYIFVFDSKVADYQSLIGSLPVDGKWFLVNESDEGLIKFELCFEGVGHA